MDKRFLGKDPAMGTTKWHHHDEMTGETVIHTEQDVTAIVEHNKNQYNDIDSRAPYGDLAKIADIPMTILFDLQKKGIWGNQKRMRKWLNDPDNRDFRTRPGKV